MTEYYSLMHKGSSVHGYLKQNKLLENWVAGKAI